MNAMFNRRAALQGSLVLAFSLIGGEALAQKPDPTKKDAQKPDEKKPPGDLTKNPELDAWIEISAGGVVTLKVGKVELGQGALTALAQICADELDVELSRLNVVSGDTARSPDEGTTTGSQSMSEGGSAVRHASAEVRALLLSMAAARLGVAEAKLAVSDGTITDKASRRSVTYWSLVGGQALHKQATGSVAPKAPSARRLIGRPVPRLDLPKKLTGEAIFVHDLRLETLVHGRIVRGPSYGATLLEVDASAVSRMPGVLKVVRDGDFLGVVAEKEWQAVKAQARLAEVAKWREGAALPEDPYAFLLGRPTQDAVIANALRKDGKTPARSLEASYRRPYQMHGSIGPSCAVAELRDGTLTFYSPSQSIFQTAEVIAKTLGLPKDKVHGKHMNGSGCYGHNGADDAAMEAALLARALPGRAVRVQWSRADEHGWEPYGPAMVTKVSAAVDERGDVLDFRYDLWSTSHNTRPNGFPGNLLAPRSLERPFPVPVPKNGGGPNYAADRNAIPGYAFPGQVVTTHFVTEMPLRVSAHRSLGAYTNVFSIESFMDELAHAAGADPIAFRLRHLTDPRGRAVLEKAQERFGWSGAPRPKGRGRGVAYARYKNIASYCAVCVEVSVDPQSLIVKALRALLVVDAGEVVNPNGLANQLEGGVIQSLSWSLKEAVRYDAQRILSRDWSQYPILTFSEVPPIEIALIDRPGDPFLGAGEAAQGPTAAALANAVFDASGLRVRDLPLTPAHLAAARRG